MEKELEEELTQLIKDLPGVYLVTDLVMKSSDLVLYFPGIEAFARDENTVTPNITSAKTFSSWYDAKEFAKNFPPCFGEVMVIAWSEVRYEHISS